MESGCPEGRKCIRRLWERLAVVVRGWHGLPTRTILWRCGRAIFRPPSEWEGRRGTRCALGSNLKREAVEEVGGVGGGLGRV